MRKVCYGAFAVFLLSLFISDCYAINDNSCNYSTQAELTKMAYQISVNYDLKKNGEENVFVINLYNLTSDLFVEFRKDGENGKTVYYSSTSNGKFSFIDSDIEKIGTYTFNIKSNKYGCNDIDLRTIIMVKPRKNYLADLDICKYDATVNFYYCKEWVENEFSLPYDELVKKIELEISKNKRTTAVTTTSIIENSSKKNNYIKYIVYGLFIAIPLNFIIVIVLMIKARRNSIYD